jgi:phage terminase small subunit
VKKAKTRSRNKNKTPKKSAKTPAAPLELESKHDLFIDEYLIDLNGTRAYQKVYGVTKKNVAAVNAARLLTNAKVVEKVAAKQKARSERVQVTGDDVLRRFWMIASADPNELSELRRTCCRYCYGVDHGYQLTDRELSEREAQHRARKNPKPTDVYDDLGGGGFNPRLAPHPECPDCGGEGEAHAFFKDTRHLSEAAKMLYAGVKTTKEGIEVKVLDQQVALQNVAKLLGLYIEKLEHTGKLTLEDILSRSWEKK